MEGVLGFARTESASGLETVEAGEYEVGDCSLTLPMGSKRLGPDLLSPAEASKKDAVSMHLYLGKSHGLESSKPGST